MTSSAFAEKRLGVTTPDSLDGLVVLKTGLLEQAEYVGGHVADARHLPLADLANRAGELDKFKAGPVLVVCQTGARSGGACRTLEKLGFAKVHSLEGGVAAWSEAGLPLKKGARK